jgi:hypothetical protein
MNESGNDRFVLNRHFQIDISGHKLIPQCVQFIAGSAFPDVALSSCLIEPGNERFVVDHDFLIDIVDHKLIRSFSQSRNVRIRSDIEIIGEFCFASCRSILAISFELKSRLRRVESSAFPPSGARISLPSTVVFIASDAYRVIGHLSLADADSCPAFDRWLRVRERGVSVDFQRVLTSRFELPLLDMSELEERSLMDRQS